ncbi:hypothetical protein ElyMa_003963300 [Elysia marginata]|uniref:Secreted protein n=1 Tax=Elysia marginata TaxID=1093978 RepID=A0AAV4FY41_9GAST|nr:hypothetical protein ElyMa_003963300 [Elysia marginata]
MVVLVVELVVVVVVLVVVAAVVVVALIVVGVEIEKVNGLWSSGLRVGSAFGLTTRISTGLNRTTTLYPMTSLEPACPTRITVSATNISAALS